MLGELEPPPRLVDWSILGLVALAVATGLASLFVVGRSAAWLVVVHAVGGLALVGLLGWKFRRVFGRVRDRSRWDGATPLSILLAAVVVAALATGVAWALTGPVWIGPWTLLTLHMLLGLVAVPLVAWHLRHRWRVPRTRDLEGRRTALQFGALLGAGVLARRLGEAAGDALPGDADRRFTGSKEEGSDAGNAFPVTSWVADDPDPVDPAEWELQVGGAVAEPLSLSEAELEPGSDRRAVLDCTSGWYSVHDWRGIRVGELLGAAGPAEGARWVRFRSVTGYRWSLPIEEARGALLATHVDGERLGHGHGYPLRLVAPGRRGFQWVKWVTAVEVTRRRDPGEWVAIFVSGL